MTPGEQSVFENGNGDAVVSTVGLRVGRDGIHLRVDMTDEGAERAGAGDHRILFRDLRKMLIANGCWEPGGEARAAGSAEDKRA